MRLRKTPLGAAVSILAVLVFMQTGCKRGACYYTCCDENNICTAGCKDGTKSAEKCAVLALEACVEDENKEVGRVQWKEISDVYCESCSSDPCSPSWWSTIYAGATNSVTSELNTANQSYWESDSWEDSETN